MFSIFQNTTSTTTKPIISNTSQKSSFYTSEQFFKLLRPRIVVSDLPLRERTELQYATHQAIYLCTNFTDVARFVRASLCRLSYDASWSVIVARGLYIQSKKQNNSVTTLSVPALATDARLIVEKATTETEGIKILNENLKLGGGGPLSFSVLAYRAGSDELENIVSSTNILATEMATTTDIRNEIDVSPPKNTSFLKSVQILRAECISRDPIYNLSGVSGSGAMTSPPITRILHLIGMVLNRTGLHDKVEGSFCAMLQKELYKLSGHICTWHIILSQSKIMSTVKRKEDTKAINIFEEITGSLAHEAAFATTFDDTLRDGQDPEVRYLELWFSGCNAIDTEQAQETNLDFPFYHVLIFRTNRSYLANLAKIDDEDWLSNSSNTEFLLENIHSIDSKSQKGEKALPTTKDNPKLRLRRNTDFSNAHPLAAAHAAATTFRKKFHPANLFGDFRVLNNSFSWIRLGAWVCCGFFILIYVTISSNPGNAPVLLGAESNVCPGYEAFGSAAANALTNCGRKGKDISWLAGLMTLLAGVLPKSIVLFLNVEQLLPSTTATLFPHFLTSSDVYMYTTNNNNNNHHHQNNNLFIESICKVFPPEENPHPTFGTCTLRDSLLAEVYNGQKTGLVYAALFSFIVAASTSYARSVVARARLHNIVRDVAKDLRQEKEISIASSVLKKYNTE